MIIALKKLREAAGISQNELARKTGYSTQFIQKIEQGKAKSLTLEAAGKFCEALLCKPGDLLEESSPSPINPRKAKEQQSKTTKIVEVKAESLTHSNQDNELRILKVTWRKTA